MSSQVVDHETESRSTDHLTAFQPVLWIAAALIVSGLCHLVWLVLTGADWNGPLSLRKPGLFGVSAGLTAWSIAWVMTKLYPYRLDRLIACAMAGGLLLEVGLITLQQWRGVPSHFNHTTSFDATIEAIMLGLILLVTAGVVWLSLRSLRLPPMDGSSAIALRGGLWLLTLSCGLGIMVTILGELNLAAGKPPEVWGSAGILKSRTERHCTRFKRCPFCPGCCISYAYQSQLGSYLRHSGLKFSFWSMRYGKQFKGARVLTSIGSVGQSLSPLGY